MKQRLAVVAVLIAFSVWVGLSCKKYPTDPEHPIEATVAGGYVGVAALGEPVANVRIEVTQADSADFSGAIAYRGATLALSNIYTDSAEDTLWFNFHRDGTLYRAQAEIQDIGLVVHVQEPSGVSDFRVNREFSGYNLTGYWSGQLSSTQWSTVNDAQFSMDQRGALFAGIVTTSFVQAYQFQLTSGGVNAGSFQLQGVLVLGGTSYPTLWSGTYTGRDTVSGVWDGGDQGSVDSGQFIFYRSYR
ncbi:hypothetical protein HZB60_05790 [candidate division KSB1 bacterium]|nr:hypothetical protein [candidate division KSB1 bacterium]